MLKRPPGNQTVRVQTPPQPPGRKNEKMAIGIDPAQKVPQWSTRTYLKVQLIKAELGLDKKTEKKNYQVNLLLSFHTSKLVGKMGGKQIGDNFPL